MANITRIKAQDPHKKREDKEPKKSKKAKNTKPAAAKVAKATPQPAKDKPVKKSEPKKPFILIRPFVAFGRYVKASWHELRQVRWPSRKYTWKMTAAMLVYCLIFLAIIVLLDLLFSFIFNHLLG